ncbi:uncharacterized protein LOC132311768 isoform X2 [Cornus florida]|uniref:uncharacterized protein LOC132311768 isoform X2 n=1 Tax=Cornus florida TaxID=4283 RepID=UPI0028A0C3E9|nr:uncharacterized protein LOC132311768 isoform X2 [Cornus florida]
MCGWLGVMEVVPKERERFKRREEASQRKRKRFKRREEKSLIIGLHFGMGGIGKKKIGDEEYQLIQCLKKHSFTPITHHRPMLRGKREQKLCKLMPVAAACL